MVVAQTLSADAAARAFQRFGEVVGLDMPLCCFETRHHAHCTIRVLFMSSQLRMFAVNCCHFHSCIMESSSLSVIPLDIGWPCASLLHLRQSCRSKGEVIVTFSEPKAAQRLLMALSPERRLRNHSVFQLCEMIQMCFLRFSVASCYYMYPGD